MWTTIHRRVKLATASESAPAPLRRSAPQSARPAPTHDIGRVPIADVAQRKPAPGANAQAYRTPNRTGLPDRLKAGVEALSGMAMDHVRVHFGSSEPARLNAQAFTRGADVHLAPGQERHLPHEAWHVVQQAQGRVRPTVEVAGTGVNDDAGLEREADRLGGASAVRGASLFAGAAPERVANSVAAPAQLYAGHACVQRVINITDGDLEGEYTKPTARSTDKLIDEVESKIGDELARGWKGWIRDRAKEDDDNDYTTDEFLDKLKEEFPQKDTTSKIRPNFPKYSYWLGTVTREIQTGEDQSGLKPADENLALPHRAPYKQIETDTLWFLTGKEKEADLDRWSDRLIVATEERLERNKREITSSTKRKKYEETVKKQLDGVKQARKKLKAKRLLGKPMDLAMSETQEFLKFANALHGNIPDYGPHVGVNVQVSDRTHLNFDEDGTLTPGSYAAATMSPHRGKGIAFTSDGKYVVMTGGYKLDPKELDKKLQALIKKRGASNTTIDSDDLDKFEIDT